VFIDNHHLGIVRVYTPSRERSHAGYPLLGAAWLLHQQGWSLSVLHCPWGPVQVRCMDNGAHMTIPHSWFVSIALEEVRDVVALRAMNPRTDRVVLWSHDGHGRVVVRCTIPDHPPGEGVSASVAAAVAAAVGTPLEVELGCQSQAQVLSGVTNCSRNSDQ